MSYKSISAFLIVIFLIISCNSESDKKIQSADSVKKDIIIAGNISNLDVSKFGDKVSFGYTDYIVGDYEELKATIDTTTGDFKTQITAYSPLQIYFYHNSGVEIIVSPGDSIHFKMDGSLTDSSLFKKSLEISGDASETNKNFITFREEFQPDYARIEQEIKKGDAELYKKFLDSLHTDRNKQIDVFLTRDDLTDTFKN